MIQKANHAQHNAPRKNKGAIVEEATLIIQPERAFTRSLMNAAKNRGSMDMHRYKLNTSINECIIKEKQS